MTGKERQAEAKIFEAAAEVFEEKGLDGARMQEIADRAGINKALLHYYYRTKDKLFDAVFEHVAGLMLSKLFVCFDDNLPWEAQLTNFSREHIDFLQQHPKMPTFILYEINRHPERITTFFTSDYITRLRRNLFAQLEEEMQQGRIARMDKIQLLISIISLNVFPFAARGILEALLQQENTTFDEFIEKRKEEVPQFVINAVKNK